MAARRDFEAEVRRTLYGATASGEGWIERYAAMRAQNYAAQAGGWAA